MVDFGDGKKASQGSAFADVVGQRDLKDGLLAVAVDDELDGLLVRGEKGTAKSTAVRGLSDLLPTQRVVADCPYSCPPDDSDRQCEGCRSRTDPPVEERSVPLVTLPLGATRDRVVGTLSVADALSGDHEFDPGLLARANRGLLYVDEVNLLDDHLVDVLLDAAADGVNRVERDGVTVTHPAEFTLIGTMNPEEGDLRPQLRDRFALQTEVTACADLDDRVAIIDRALGDGSDDSSEPAGDDHPRKRLLTARELLGDVELPTEFRQRIAELCRDAGLDGHRGDIATARASRAFAALDGRTTVLESDIERAAAFALPHRLQSRPFEEPPDVDDVLDDQFEDGENEQDGEQSADDGSDGQDEDEPASESESEDEAAGENDGDQQEESGDDGGGEKQPDGDAEDGTGSSGSPAPAEAGDGDGSESDSGAGDESGSDNGDDEQATPLLPGQATADVGDSAAPDVDTPAVDADGGHAAGRATATGTDRGATVRTERARRSDDVDAAASVRAAASRGGDGVQSRDLRKSVRAGDAETLVVFAVDASASMRPAMRAAKGTVLELLKDAYQARDEVAFVTFAGDGADVVLPPTDSVSLAARHLKELPTGDKTPLPDGLTAATEVLARADPDAGIAVVVTDGRANAVEGSAVDATRSAARSLGDLADRTIVVDAGDGGRAGLTDTVAEATDAAVVPLDALTAERIDAAVDGSGSFTI